VPQDFPNGIRFTEIKGFFSDDKRDGKETKKEKKKHERNWIGNLLCVLCEGFILLSFL
jgi:hypothetical protein